MATRNHLQVALQRNYVISTFSWPLFGDSATLPAPNLLFYHVTPSLTLTTCKAQISKGFHVLNSHTSRLFCICFPAKILFEVSILGTVLGFLDMEIFDFPDSNISFHKRLICTFFICVV